MMTNCFGESDRQEFNETSNPQRVFYLKIDPSPVPYDNFNDQGCRTRAQA